MQTRHVLASTALTALLGIAACAEPHPTEVDVSRDEFARQEADAAGYTYARYFQSWVGTWHRTTVVVAAGEVVSRSYESSEGTTWIETGADLGTHELGYPAATLPELYDQCEDEILTVDPVSNEVIFEVDELGILSVCTYRPLDCDDDCIVGIAIESFAFDSGCGAALFCG